MSKSYFKIITVLFILAFSEVVTAQFSSFAFEHFTIEDGLSNNSINAVLQTSDGFLWIATKDGLNRFDGQNFVVFKHDPNSENSLPENYIMSLFESRDGSFWVGTWGGGLCKYDPVHESFIKITTQIKNDSYVQCISEDDFGWLWFGTYTGGLFKYHPKTKHARSFNIETDGPLKIMNNNVTTLAINEDNSLWIGTWGGGFSFFDEKKNYTKHFLHSNDKNSLSHNNIWFVQKEEGEKIIISSDFGFDLFDPKTNTFTHNANIDKKFESILNSPIRQSYRDSYNRLWIGTYEYQGLFMIEKNRSGNTQIQHVVREQDDPQSLTMNRIRWIYQDRKKNIWIGTEDGLNKLPAMKPFVQYRFFPSRKLTLGGRVVSGIVEGRDSILWVGFNGSGFDKIDLKRNSVEHFYHSLTDKNSLNENDVTALFEDKSGKVWLGTTHSGLDLFDPKSRSFKHFTVDAKNPESVNLNWIQAVLEAKDGSLFVGTNAGLEVFDRRKQALSSFNPIVNGKEIFPKVFSINALFEDKEENLWVGTWLDGLFRYDKRAQKFYRYVPDASDPYSISANKITCVMEDSHGFIWIGTHSGGINKFEKSTGRFYHFSTKHGLPNDVVFGILEDGAGNLWISTLNGLSKFDPKKNKFRNYDVADGITHNQFNWHASFKNRNGQMYFGTVNGFFSFNPDLVKIDPVPPSVALTSFKVFGKEAALPQSLPATKEIMLNYDQNFFSVAFAALDIAPSHKHQFKYFLEGIDPAWVLSEQQSMAFYTDINPGKYKFFVKASNADGVWSNPVTLSIIIYPAWWMTWWFKVLIGISFIVLGYLAYLYRLKQLLAIQNIRLNIANDLHDEIGSNLSSISVDSQMLLESSSLNDTEQELASFISKTAKETVDTMRDIIWFINPRSDFDTDMIIKMKETAAKLLAGVIWTFKVTDDIKLEKFNLDVRRNIFLIYKEVLHNIIRHSNTKTCLIDLTGNNNFISLLIKDDGIGFDLKTVQENNGLRSIKRRAEKINAAINISSEIGKGTSVNLIVSFGKQRSKF